MGFQFWMLFHWEYHHNNAAYGDWYSTSYIQNNFAPEILNDSDVSIIEDDGDQSVGTWKDGNRVIIDIDTEQHSKDYGTIVYRIFSDSGLFDIDTSTGEVTLSSGGGVDYDTMQGTYTLFVTATSTALRSPKDAKTFFLTIEEDINQGIVIEQELSDIEVVVGDVGGIRLNLNDYFTDLDGDHVKFNIIDRSVTGEGAEVGKYTTSNSSSITYNGVISITWDAVDENFTHSITFTATDGEFIVYDTIVIYAVPKEGDEAPVFVEAGASPNYAAGSDLRIDENVEVVDVLAVYTATDYDDDDAGITYSLNGDVPEGISIGSVSGVVSYNGSGFDYETEESYIFDIVATSNGLDVSQTVTLNVDNINEGIIVFSSPLGQPEFIKDITCEAHHSCGTLSVDLDYYYGDIDGDILDFEVLGVDLEVISEDGVVTNTADYLSVEVVISDTDSSVLLADVAVVNEDDSWSSTYEISISATDGEFTVYDTFVVEVY